MNYELHQGNTLLGILRSMESDMFWLDCKFEPTEAFQTVKPVFDADVALLNESLGDDADAWTAIDEQRAALGLRLVEAESGDWCDEFLLHIDEEDVWFRYMEFHQAAEVK